MERRMNNNTKLMSKKNLAGNLKEGVNKGLKKIASNPYKKTGLSFLDVKMLKHLPAGKLHRRKFLDGEILFYDPFEFLYAAKEIFVDEIYKQNLQSPKYILDCGAHIGLSVIYLKKQFHDTEIVAFEPDEKNFDLLQKNLALQKITGVNLQKKAVWVNNEDLKFSAGNSMSSKISEEVADQTVTVKACRLKDFLTREVDFLKLDIEGAEFKVLEDIREELHFIKNLFIEYHGFFNNQDELVKILSWVEQSGFSFYIQEAAKIFKKPFVKEERETKDFDIQLNIYCSRK